MTARKSATNQAPGPRGDALAFLIAGYVRLVRLTVRWRWEGREHLDALRASGEPFICAFWHARLLMIPSLQAELGRPSAVLISLNADGEVAASVAARFGIEVVRGSGAHPGKPDKAKHGAAGLKALVRAAGAGRVVVVTPDGPRGPAGVAQLGIGQLARLTGLPVLPVSYAVRHARRLRSWDRFVVPLPFGRGAFAFGPPVRGGRRDGDGGRAAAEEVRAAVEAALHHADAVAERAVGGRAERMVPA